MIPKSFVEEVTRKTDIETLARDYVELKVVGSQLKGSCPFCKSPSFTLSKGKQIYKCFKCGKGGGVLTFVQEIQKKTFPVAVRFLADRLKLEVPEVNP